MKSLALFLIASLFLSSSLNAAVLSPLDRQILARNIASGSEYTVLIMATKDGRHLEYVDYLKKNGVAIRYNFEPVGYLRVRAPTKDMIRLAAHDAVLAAATEGGQYLLASDRAAKASIQTASDHSNRKVDFRNYLKNLRADSDPNGFEESRIVSFKKANPTFDGRGTTIAIVEGVVDPFMPELKHALDINGNFVEKITGIDTAFAFDPDAPLQELYENPGGRLEKNFVRLTDTALTSGRIMKFETYEIKVPRQGSYRVGKYFAPIMTGASSLQDSSGNRFVLLVHDAKTGCYYLDLNADLDLSDEECAREYTRFEDMTYAQPEGYIAEAPVLIIPSRDDEGVVVSVPYNHTVSVALAAAGHRYFGSSLSGVAPAARLHLTNIDLYRTASLIEGLIQAARQKDVDIITIQTGPKDIIDWKESVISVIADRIVLKLDKLIFASAGNTTTNGPNTVRQFQSAQMVITVGQYHSPRVQSFMTGERNPVPHRFPSATGPTEDGRLKPDLLAPSSLITPSLEYMQTDLYGCPNILPFPRLDCPGGTSMAAPVAAGAGALLWSAARQAGLDVKASDIRAALLNSARHIDGFAPYEEGNGVLDVVAAWDYLQKSLRTKPAIVSVDAPVATPFSPYFARPNRGEGLYEIAGWTPGATHTRSIQLRRTSGRQGEETYLLRFVGERSSAFKLMQNTIRLPLNKSAEIQVHIAPQAEGVHSALLELFDPKARIPAARIPLTVVAGRELQGDAVRRAVLSATATGDSPPLFFFHVPDKARALQVSVSGGPKYEGMPLIYAPYGDDSLHIDKYIESPRLAALHADISEEVGAQPIERVEQSYFLPAQGLWWVSLPGAQPGKTYSLSVQAVVSNDSSDVQPAGGLMDEAANWDAVASKLASPEARVIEGQRFRGQVSTGQNIPPALIPIDIPENTLRIVAEARLQDHDSGSNVPLTFTLMECKVFRCYARLSGAGSGKAGFVMAKPPAGRWFLAVDALLDHRQPTLLNYEIMLASAESPDASAVTTIDSVDFSLAEAVAPASVRRKYQVCRYVELIDSQFQKMDYWLVKAPKYYKRVVASSEAIPLQRRPLGGQVSC